jgi:hypothetical protein
MNVSNTGYYSILIFAPVLFDDMVLEVFLKKYEQNFVFKIIMKVEKELLDYFKRLKINEEL